MTDKIFKYSGIALLVFFVILLFLPTPNTDHPEQQAQSTTLFLNLAAISLLVTAATGLLKLSRALGGKTKPATEMADSSESSQ